MTRILAINGSYRVDGITDQTIEIMSKFLSNAGAEVDIVLLRDLPLEFCLNCRVCTQQPGETPGTCVHDDGMHKLIERIENSDGFILASPTNFDAATAIFKRFMERLVVYAYWPWGTNVPQFRKANAPRKKAVLASSCAAPGVMGRLLFNTRKQLRIAARTIGADTNGTIFTGLVANDPHQILSVREQKKARTLAAKLI